MYRETSLTSQIKSYKIKTFFYLVDTFLCLQMQVKPSVFSATKQCCTTISKLNVNDITAA